jgi:cell division protein FtsZ
VLTPQEQERILKAEGSSRARRAAAKMSQGMLPLEVVAKGRFDKSEATVRDGQDLDIPTFMRRGIALN